MSYELPTFEVVERHYWTLLVRDETRPDGEEWYKTHDTKEEAEAELQRLIRKRLGTKHNG